MLLIELEIIYGKNGTLKRYLGTLNKLLKKEQEDLPKMIEVEAEKLTNEDNRDYRDFYAEELWYLKKDYPNILRQSFLMACYSCLEHDLFRLCDYFQKTQDLPIPEKRGIQSARQYLEKEAKFKSLDKLPSWEEILHLQDIRNCIAHNDGRLGEYKKRDDKIRKYIQKKSDLLSLEEDDTITIRNEYCMHVLNMIEAFLDALFQADREEVIKE
jgi:hypothetical protein